ncbi:MAG: ATP-dependent DNA helicase RecG [Acidimicrobiales bacterium]|nr:ATP-dependent DNA helicase RecG [Acidimicrobiales bacterium]
MSGSAPLTLRDLEAIPIGRLHGVGPKKEAALRGFGITDVLGLLQLYPRRWVDRTNEARVRDLVEGEQALVLGRVERISGRPLGGSPGRRGGRSIVTATVSDGSGRMRVTFFNQPWRERQLAVGTNAAFWGRVEQYQGQPQMTNPVVDLIGDRTGRIVPIYPQSEKADLTTWEIAGLVEEALRRAALRGFADPVPAPVLGRLGLCDRGTALHSIHAPTSMADVAAARARLVFDELLRVQVALVARKQELGARSVGHRHDDRSLVERFLPGLPWQLTGAQERVIEEVLADLARPHPMHRLLQGDVGSGKTVVAVATLLGAVSNGGQGALMAPTEVLAEQHHESVGALVEGLTVPHAEGLFDERPVRVALLTNRTTAAERRELLDGLEAGRVDIVIGTHALIQEGVRFRRLGAVVIDEQHRFGVEQRAVLREGGVDDQGQGRVPDVLVMTATPIPRTAALTVYGDLDTSTLDQLPPGRKPITTRWAAGADAEQEVWAAVRAEVAAGRQAYVVCPLIEESVKLEASAATEVHDRLAGGELAGLRLGLLHGRVLPRDRQLTMDAFRAGGLDVLVATTVIEVGVDVPNASVMAILDADRFGIAQLHQLRGRVGRGADHSRCFLVTGTELGPEATARLRAVVDHASGFELAEIDLDLRGEGQLLGDRQKGRTDFRLASLRRDRACVETAREVAVELVGDDPALAAHPGLADEVALLVEDSADYLFRS